MGKPSSISVAPQALEHAGDSFNFAYVETLCIPEPPCNYPPERGNEGIGDGVDPPPPGLEGRLAFENDGPGIFPGDTPGFQGGPPFIDLL